MTRLNKHVLLEQLAAYGYPVMKPVSQSDPETVLEGLVRQQEGRLLEGFAVVLWNALREKATLRWELQRWNPENELGVMALRRLTCLLAVSYLLFRLFGLERDLQERVRKLLAKCKDGDETLRNLEAQFTTSASIAMNGVRLSADRLKSTFRTYAVGTPERREDEETTHALELELLLSELFTPRQKELLRKRAEHAEMTKTEKAYFYRTVSKRLKALANEEVHALARRLLRK